MTGNTEITNYQTRVLSALKTVGGYTPVTTEVIRLYLTGIYGYTTGVKVGNALAQLRDRFGLVEGQDGSWKLKYVQ
ncbi:MAG: hypothetical protein J4428_00245 [Candidatus Aenigmarchaeota archaeon]|nr:hypothetical protein [Candidatus Aenigmarchaeota archaeon]